MEGFIVEFRSFRPKTFLSVNFGQKWPIFGHKWPNFGHFRIFPAYRVWFSLRRPYAQLSYQKLGGFIAAFGSYRSKTFRSVIFGQKWPNFGHKWPNFGHLRIFPDHTPTFSEKVHQNSFLEQISRKFIAVFGSYRSKTLKNVNFGQKWPNFGHKWPNFGHLRILPA